jgi:DNA-binding MarR family transcriptional regulator
LGGLVVDHEKLTQLVESYIDLSFRIHKTGEMIITRELNDLLTIEQEAVMRYIRENGPCPSSALSKAFFVEKSAVTAIINRLENKGYIQRMRSDEDRRVVFLRLTEEGARFHQECWEKINNLLMKIISQLNKEDIESFMKTYEKLANILEQQVKEQKGVHE